MVLVGGNMPGAYLELTSRELPRPLWRTLPIVLVAGFLTMMLVATVLLRRQVRQISRAESAWRTEAAWRQAMEDSALVGLRARDAEGRILYVNRTFCDMWAARQLVGLLPPMPYWPPDALMKCSAANATWRARPARRLRPCGAPDGRLVSVMVFSRRDRRPRKTTGWMVPSSTSPPRNWKSVNGTRPGYGLPVPPDNAR
jgi:two-component system sensor histidine kinase DctS